jgi:hypothetical protein
MLSMQLPPSAPGGVVSHPSLRSLDIVARGRLAERARGLYEDEGLTIEQVADEITNGFDDKPQIQIRASSVRRLLLEHDVVLRASGWPGRRERTQIRNDEGPQQPRVTDDELADLFRQIGDVDLTVLAVRRARHRLVTADQVRAAVKAAGGATPSVNGGKAAPDPGRRLLTPAEFAALTKEWAVPTVQPYEWDRQRGAVA